MNKRCTIRDVAKAAGVSVATVSNVFNGINKVSEENRQMILAVAKELDYQPNMVARSLSMQKSGMIGLLLPIVEDGEEAGILLQKNPYYAEFLSGMEQKAAELKYDIIIRGLRPEESCREWIMRRQLEGAVFVGNASDVISRDSKELGNRLVLLDTYDKGILSYDNIRVEDEKGGRLATSYLREKGHKNIAFAGSYIQYDGCIRRRFLGYQKEMEAQGWYRQDLVYKNALSYEGGIAIGKQMLKSQIPITAVFAASDTLALGIMSAYREAGKDVPADLSVVGFDNTSTCDISHPKLTTIDQNTFLKGMKAVEILSQVGGTQEEPASIILPVSLKERESVREI